MTPKEKRRAALEYARGVNASKLFEGDEVEIADHWLAGFKEGEKNGQGAIQRSEKSSGGNRVPHRGRLGHRPGEAQQGTSGRDSGQGLAGDSERVPQLVPGSDGRGQA